MKWGRALLGWGVAFWMLFGSPLLVMALPGEDSMEGAEATEENLSEKEEADFLEDILEEKAPEELSQEELNQLIESYLRLEEGAGPGKDFVQDSEYEKVTNPELVMEPAEGGRIRYTLPNGNFFFSTVPRGMISSGPVDIWLPSGAVGIVKKDEGMGSISDSWHFTEKGNYQLQILSYQSQGETGDDYHVYEVYFYFTILSAEDGSTGVIPAPEGFQITQARLDGKKLPLESGRYFFLKEDGRYQITCQAREYEELVLETDFVRDTTAPFLTFMPEAQDGVYAEPVEFYPSEPGCQIRINYNGDQGYAAGTRLTAAGTYGLGIQDKAGNERWYSFRIRQTYDLMDIRILAAGLIFLAATGIWMVFLRRNMKVI